MTARSAYHLATLTRGRDTVRYSAPRPQSRGTLFAKIQSCPLSWLGSVLIRQIDRRIAFLPVFTAASHELGSPRSLSGPTLAHLWPNSDPTLVRLWSPNPSPPPYMPNFRASLKFNIGACDSRDYPESPNARCSSDRQIQSRRSLAGVSWCPTHPNVNQPPLSPHPQGTRNKTHRSIISELDIHARFIHSGSTVSRRSRNLVHLPPGISEG